MCANGDKGTDSENEKKRIKEEIVPTLQKAA